MKRLLTASLVALAAIAFAAPALAQTPPPPTEVPFPAAKADVFVYADTVTAPGTSVGAGVRTNYFAPGASVVFRAFAGDVATGKVLTDKDVKYFYVTIPGQPTLKLTFGSHGSRFLWTATWTIPADYAAGAVPFQVLIKTSAKKYGSFQQAPVATAQLAVTKPA